MKFTSTTACLTGFGGQSIAALAYSAVPNIWPLGSTELNFSDNDALKSFKGGVCVNSFLGQEEKSLLNKSDVNVNEGQNQGNKFKNPKGHAKGCVAVSWNKKTWENDHGKGEIKWEWLYSIGNETIVTYGLWTTNQYNLNVQWRTVYIDKQAKVNAWKLGHISKEEMPKNPDFFFEGEEHWGFNPDFTKICSSGNCQNGHKGEARDEYKGTGDADGYGRDRFTQGTKNFWPAFLLFSGDLNQLDQLVKEEGTGSQR